MKQIFDTNERERS